MNYTIPNKETKVKSIMLTGVGGQGTILAAKILSEGLAAMGKDVKMSEIHGMSQRGGSVTSHVRYGERVFSPVIEAGTADCICAFEKLEGLRYLAYLRRDGLMLVNDFALAPLPVLTGKAAYPPDVLQILEKSARTRILAARAAAETLGNSRVQNIYLLGALVRSLKLDSEGFPWERMLEELVKPQYVDINKKAFNQGMQTITAAEAV